MGDLGCLSSTTSRIGKERSLTKKIRSKGMEGLASNTSYHGNCPG